MSVKLGDRVKDTISGATGIVVSLSEWLYGCMTVGVRRESLDKDGKVQDILWFDEPQLQVVENAVLSPADAVPRPSTGGPDRPHPQR